MADNGLDSDVYWKSASTTSYNVTPTFQTPGATTLPPQLVLFNTIIRATINSPNSNFCAWGNGCAHGENIARSAFSWHEDNQPTSDVSRTTNSNSPIVIYNNADVETKCRAETWGGYSGGRGFRVNMVDQDATAYICHKSLRFGDAPWMSGSIAVPQADETTLQIAMPFAPDWIWIWSNVYGGDEWISPYYATSATWTESFSHRDGTYENWGMWDEDNQNYTDSETLYSQSACGKIPVNGVDYAVRIKTLTWNDNGVVADWENGNNTLGYRYHFIAGKNANSKVGNFILSTSAPGDDAEYRASDGTIKITTGFKPKMVFFIGGNRSTEGISNHITMGRGFAGEADEWAMAMSIQDNDNTSDVYCGQWNERCFARLAYNSTTLNDYCSLNAMEDDGFRVNLDDAGSYAISYLAMGDPPAKLVLPYQPSILRV